MHPGSSCNVDAKDIPPHALAEQLELHSAVERAVVRSSPQYLLKLKSMNPRIRRLPPLSDPKDLENLGRDAATLRGRRALGNPLSRPDRTMPRTWNPGVLGRAR